LQFLSFFLLSHPALRHLPSFPTRRSSDLAAVGQDAVGVDGAGDREPELDLGVADGVAADDRAAGRDAPLGPAGEDAAEDVQVELDRKSTRLNSSHVSISYAVFCLKKKTAT